MSEAGTIRLSAKERQHLRYAVRSHPEVLGQVQRLSDISTLDKKSLLQAAVALGINVEAAKSGALLDHLPAWDSDEGREQQRRSDEKPAFSGVIEENMTFVFAGASTPRTLSVAYEVTPDWPYIDPDTGDEVRGWEQGSLRYELSVRRGVTSILSNGQGKARQRSSKQVWVNCTELVCEGVFGKELESVIGDRIDEACLRENKARKERHSK